MTPADGEKPGFIACAQCGARIEPFDATLSRQHQWICKNCDAGLRYEAQVVDLRAAAAQQRSANQLGAAAAVGVGAVGAAVIAYVLASVAFGVLILYALYKLFIEPGPYYGTP